MTESLALSKIPNFTYDLNIVMGLQCNFECRHCLNDSKPDNKTLDLTQQDIALLVQQVSKVPQVRQVTFTGGEPLLYLEQLEKMVEALRAARPDLVFAIQTNSSLFYNHEQKIKDLKIDLGLLSFSEEHSKFINILEFKKNIAKAKELFSKVFVYYNHCQNPDMNLISQLGTGIDTKIYFQCKIQSGRHTESLKTEVESQPVICPSLNTLTKVIKIIYISGKGFSICGGPLLYDKLIDECFLFSPTIYEVHSKLATKFALKFSGTNILTEFGENHCNNCRNIFENKIKNEQLYKITNDQHIDQITSSLT